MGETAADMLVKNIIDWGVDTVFGLPGDGINGSLFAGFAVLGLMAAHLL